MTLPPFLVTPTMYYVLRRDIMLALSFSYNNSRDREIEIYVLNCTEYGASEVNVRTAHSRYSSALVSPRDYRAML